MAKTKTSAAVKNRYAAKTYDRMAIFVPAGQKSTVEAFARAHNDSINGVTNKALLQYMSLTDWPELPKTETDGEG